MVRFRGAAERSQGALAALGCQFVGSLMVNGSKKKGEVMVKMDGQWFLIVIHGGLMMIHLWSMMVTKCSIEIFLSMATADNGRWLLCRAVDDHCHL